MADWYVSSAVYATIPVFQVNHAYNVGDIIKPTAPAPKGLYVFRCTTAGTSSTEPGWNANYNINGTITTGTVTFTDVTANSTYGWAAAAGDFATLTPANGYPRFNGGDRVFVSSDHSETQTSGTYYGSGLSANWNYISGQIFCVNRAGSVPPGPADLRTGATMTVTEGNNIVFDSYFPVYHYGITYVCGGSFVFNYQGAKSHHFDTCQLNLSTLNPGARFTTNNVALVIFNNTTLQFGHIGQTFAVNLNPLELLWMNTPNAITGTFIPNVLFSPGNYTPMMVTARGVDLSAITTMLTQNYISCLFDSCRIAPTVQRYSIVNVSNTRDRVELVNCFDGSNFISESYQPSGAVTTEFVITLVGGAKDNVGVYSHKLVSNPNIDKFVQPLCGFWLDSNYTTVGGSRTATVEIISSGSLNTDEIVLWVEYQGTTGSSVTSFVSSLPPLTTPTVITSSIATWNSSPTTPVRQKLQVSFTPMVAGPVRAQVRLGKANAIVYYNPQLTIT